jgi:iron complex outermembrane receptor protein
MRAKRDLHVLRSAVVILGLGLSCMPQAFSEENRMESQPKSQSEVTEEISTPEITVLGQPSKRKSVSDYVPTVSELSGLKLEKKKQTTLGETLSREAGVSSTFFGPNASRPVIRGLEGERVRVLQDGLGVLDASGTSPDHAVSSDPLLTERVEIVRGSAALLYGSSAIGGVVNVVNRRIPDRLEIRPDFLFNSRGSSTDSGRTGGVMGRASLGRFMFHADGALRGAEDYRIPGLARSERLRDSDPLPPGEEDVRGKVVNSSNNTFDGALGTSYVGDSGHLGASFSRFGTKYGTVAEPNVIIDLDRYRLDLAGEIKTDGFVQSARIRGAGSYYKHNELEGSEVATTFTNRGAESRVDLKHAPVAGVEGIFGFQQQYSLFSAVGEEAFLPTTTNTSYALFVYEEVPLGRFTPTFGARIDRSGVSSETSSQFGVGESFGFWTPSVSAGLLYKLDDEFTLGLNAALTQRAPNYQELFADGPHVATGIFETGDRALSPEIGRSLELSLRHKQKNGEGRVSAFVQDFSRFVALSPTGSDDVDSGLPIFAYRPVTALLVGAELEYRQRLPWTVGRGAFEVGLTLDWVRGMNRSDSTNLPRMTPVRETLAFGYRSSAFSTELEVQRSEAQGIVAPNELPTDAYTLFNLGAEVPILTSAGRFSILGRFNNIFDVEARNHVSFVKDVAPLPGRNVVIGLQARI